MTAVFSNWLISTSYAPFIAFPKSYEFPSYMQDSIEIIQVVKNCSISNTFQRKREKSYEVKFNLDNTSLCSDNGFVMVIKTARKNDFRKIFFLNIFKNRYLIYLVDQTIFAFVEFWPYLSGNILLTIKKED